MNEWISVDSLLPENQNTITSRRRYMAYSPRYGGHLFRCWYCNGFGAIYAESILDGVTHYRVAGKSEKDHQISGEELNKMESTK